MQAKLNEVESFSISQSKVEFIKHLSNASLREDRQGEPGETRRNVDRGELAAARTRMPNASLSEVQSKGPVGHGLTNQYANAVDAAMATPELVPKADLGTKEARARGQYLRTRYLKKLPALQAKCKALGLPIRHCYRTNPSCHFLTIKELQAQLNEVQSKGRTHRTANEGQVAAARTLTPTGDVGTQKDPVRRRYCQSCFVRPNRLFLEAKCRYSGLRFWKSKT